MEKHKLLALVKKTADYFDDYKTPTAIYNSLWDDIYIKQLVTKLSAEDIIFFSFLDGQNCAVKKLNLLPALFLYLLLEII